MRGCFDKMSRGSGSHAMNVSAEDLPFLRELVKASRQRVHHLTWIDRDGTKRLTALSEAEFTRLKGVSTALKLPPAEVLRQAAHIPNAR
jgi:hypothetical protein